MREILFRGKRIDNGEWVYGHFAKHPSPIQIGSDYSPWYIFVPPRDPDDDGGWYNVDPGTVGQYTGLTDKNGKKIFEGDILKCSYGPICIVEWDKENARFLGFTITKERYIAYVGREPKSEVIGNIHDNPELLKGGAE